MFEAITVITWLLFVLGFYDRVFFLLSMTIGFFFSAWAMNDGTFVLDQVYNINTATWIQYTISVYPYILLMAIPVIASFMIFIVKVIPNEENDIMF